MLRLRDVDRMLILTTTALVATGLIMVYSTSYIMAMKKYGSEYFFVKKQFIFILIGFLFFIIASKIDYHFYQRWVYLLVLAFIPGVGNEVGGARRWLKLGPLTFQPSEPAKLAVIMYLAYYLSTKKEKIKTFSRGFLPPIIMSGLFIALILKQPDFGTALSLGAIAIILMFIAGVRLRHIFSLVVFAMPFLYLMVSRVDYRMKRMLTF